MKKIFASLFSMQLTVVLLLMFAISAGLATFIENDFGTDSARAVVYNAGWFEVLLVVLGINLLGSIFMHRLLQRKKYIIFLFHIAFIIILIGSGITRYYGFEGMMHIREGKSSNQIISSQVYLSASYTDDDEEVWRGRPVLLAQLGSHNYSFNVEKDGKDISIETIEFVPNASLVIAPMQGGDPIVNLMMVNGNTRQSVVLRLGETMQVDGTTIGFNDRKQNHDVSICVNNDSLFLEANELIMVNSMGSGSDNLVARTNKVLFTPKQLYTIGENKFVLRQFERSAALRPVPSNQAGGGGRFGCPAG